VYYRRNFERKIALLAVGNSMDTQQASVSELKEYWERVDKLKAGEHLAYEDYIPLSHMPPWINICFELDWRSHRADGGYFSKRRVGKAKRAHG
jgi:hypothetical protein